MRILLATLLLLPLYAQETPKPEAPEAAPEEKQEAAPAAPQDQAAPDAAAAAGDAVFSGTLDIGNRWRDFTGGHIDTYRSVVNLRGGLRLFAGEFTIQDPGRRLFDRLDFRANNWGGDPYNTLSVSARKNGLYDLTSNYRNIIYYNFLPSFANPFQETGVLLNQRSYDIHRRITDIHLDLRPGTRIIPFLAYSRNSNFGTGITTFVASSNEYPVHNRIRDHLDNYRGGVRLEMDRWHVTLEQGGTVLKDDQEVFAAGEFNTGNRGTPFLGRTLFLSDVLQAYGVRGDSLYTKALVTANPLPWLNVFGQFLYSMSKNDVGFTQHNAGLFAQLSPLLFFTAQQDMFAGVARMPRTGGSAGFEARPFARLRILQGWRTDRLHTAASGILGQQLFQENAPSVTLPPLAETERLVMNYNHHQIDAFYDLTRNFTLRGGHRYVWGDSILPATGLAPIQRGELSRQVGIAGLNFRALGKISANFEFEGASSDRTYFRTSLHDYQWIRARARYQALPSLGFQANFTYLNNDNPTPGIDYDVRSRNNSISVFWTPGGGQRYSVLAEYTRSTFRSDIFYLAPQDLVPERSFYRDNAHTAYALAEITAPVELRPGLSPRIAFGGSLFRSSGSRPTRFWQPVGRLLLPVHRYVSVVTEWRWYGFGQPFYRFEEFRTHLFTTGLRITR